MAVVQNMSEIIATEVGRGLGVAMQNAAKSGPPHAGGTNCSEEAKPYTQDQVATLSRGNECEIPHENVATFQNGKNA
jgi:hypothetical protein